MLLVRRRDGTCRLIKCGIPVGPVTGLRSLRRLEEPAALLLLRMPCTSPVLRVE